MNIELRNIQIQDRQSEETTAFTSSLWINGKKIGYAKNSGKGGSTDYGLDNYHDQVSKKILADAESYCLQLAPLSMDKYGIHESGESVSLPMSLELFIDLIIDDLIDKKEKNKFRQKQLKHQKNAILVGDDTQYKRITWDYSIDELLKHETGRAAIKNTVSKYKKSMKPGERILNTNIPGELL